LTEPAGRDGSESNKTIFRAEPRLGLRFIDWGSCCIWLEMA
jgi:hypothetical protein